MKIPIKSILIEALIGGLGFAVFAAAFNYFDRHDFKIWTFIINTLFFGIFTSLSRIYSLKKQNEKKKNDTNPQ